MAKNFLTPVTVEGVAPFSLVYSYPGVLVAGVGTIPIALPPRTVTFLYYTLLVGTAPTGANLIVDINVSGVTIFPGAKPTITATSTNGSGTTNISSGVTGTPLPVTIDIDQIGSTVAGADLTVTLWYA